jgi:hypothetical protein
MAMALQVMNIPETATVGGYRLFLSVRITGIVTSFFTFERAVMTCTFQRNSLSVDSGQGNQVRIMISLTIKNSRKYLGRLFKVWQFLYSYLDTRFSIERGHLWGVPKIKTITGFVAPHSWHGFIVNPER